MRVGVTGAGGFLGWHVRCQALARNVDVVQAGTDLFRNPAVLAEFVAKSDVIIHAAGVNRAESDDSVVAQNAQITQALVAAMNVSGARPVVYANSAKSEAPGAYGGAKQQVSDTLGGYLAERNMPFIDLVLPHLFGEFGRPFYNSGVATFAHQLAHGLSAEVNPDGRLELVHAQDVATIALDLAAAPVTERRRVVGQHISVGEAWNMLSAGFERYVTQGTVPDLPERFNLQMFNMLRSHLYTAGHYPVSLRAHADSRGMFAELCRADGLGQTSVSTTHPGITRGDHFHFEKIERFVVVGGQARIRLRRILTDEISVFDVDASEPVFIDMPPLVTHNITNTGSSLLSTIFWSADLFDPTRPDTIVDPVETKAEVA
jgi:UDP-2-acetamido-2,6-beta-L-arabino-hexul-4-ose reductase